MVSLVQNPTVFDAKDRGFPIETARACAVLLLVSYHVIGSRYSGLQLQDPHPLRYAADLLVDLRMPLFALIAGMVYALRPVAPADLPAFLRGKLRRLAIPGAVAITVFAIISTLFETRFVEARPVWQYHLWSFMHFWFLQALLLIMLLYCSADILTRGRVLWPVLAAAVLFTILKMEIPTTFMAADKIDDLLPYFLTGIVLIRYQDMIDRYRGVILSLALAALLAGLVWNLWILDQTGRFSASRNDLQTLLFGAGIGITAMLVLPTIPALNLLGPFAYSIYLYHLLATSVARRGLHAFGVDNVTVNVLLGTAAGLAVPAAIHLLASRHRLSRRLVLGLRN